MENITTEKSELTGKLISCKQTLARNIKLLKEAEVKSACSKKKSLISRLEKLFKVVLAVKTINTDFINVLLKVTYASNNVAIVLLQEIKETDSLMLTFNKAFDLFMVKYNV